MRRFISGLTAILLLSFLSAGCTGAGTLNALTPTRGYDLAANVPYDSTRNLRLDIYAPQGVQNAPVVLFFFGGSEEEGETPAEEQPFDAFAGGYPVPPMPGQTRTPTTTVPSTRIVSSLGLVSSAVLGGSVFACFFGSGDGAGALTSSSSGWNGERRVAALRASW